MALTIGHIIKQNRKRSVSVDLSVETERLVCIGVVYEWQE